MSGPRSWAQGRHSPFAVQSLCIRASACVSTEKSNFSRGVHYLWHTASSDAFAKGGKDQGRLILYPQQSL